MSGHDTFDLPILSRLWPVSWDAGGITDLADQAVILPLTVGVALVFWASGWRRGAIAWISAIGASLVLIIILKLRYFACGDFVSEGSVDNPSGHTAAAAAVYGGLLSAVARSIWDDKNWAVFCAIASSAAIASVVGETRLTLDMHSIMEVMLGGAIGISGAASFALLSGAPSHAVQIGRVLAAAMLAMAVFYGSRLSSEAHIQSVANWIWPSAQCL
jgi:membrane-associated phospholipid phosphatase